MNVRSLLIPMLVLAAVLLDVAVGIRVGRPVLLDESSPAFVLYQGLVLGQLAVLAAWIVYGKGISVYRLFIALVAVWSLSYPIGHDVDRVATRAFFVLGFYLAMVAIPLASVRLCGFTLVDDTDQHSVRDVPGGPQYSLSSILAWMTALCALLGIGPSVGLTWGAVPEMMIYLLPFVFTALTAHWCVFCCRRWPLRIGLPLGACPAISAATGAGILPGFGAWPFAMASLVEAISVSLAAYSFMIVGIRFVRRPSFRGCLYN